MEPFFILSFEIGRNVSVPSFEPCRHPVTFTGANGYQIIGGRRLTSFKKHAFFSAAGSRRRNGNAPGRINPFPTAPILSVDLFPISAGRCFPFALHLKSGVAAEIDMLHTGKVEEGKFRRFFKKGGNTSGRKFSEKGIHRFSLLSRQPEHRIFRIKFPCLFDPCGDLFRSDPLFHAHKAIISRPGEKTFFQGFDPAFDFTIFSGKSFRFTDTIDKAFHLLRGVEEKSLIIIITAEVIDIFLFHPGFFKDLVIPLHRSSGSAVEAGTELFQQHSGITVGIPDEFGNDPAAGTVDFVTAVELGQCGVKFTANANHLVFPQKTQIPGKDRSIKLGIFPAVKVKIGVKGTCLFRPLLYTAFRMCHAGDHQTGDHIGTQGDLRRGLLSSVAVGKGGDEFMRILFGDPRSHLIGKGKIPVCHTGNTGNIKGTALGTFTKVSAVALCHTETLPLREALEITFGSGNKEPDHIGIGGTRLTFHFYRFAPDSVEHVEILRVLFP